MVDNKSKDKIPTLGEDLDLQEKQAIEGKQQDYNASQEVSEKVKKDIVTYVSELDRINNPKSNAARPAPIPLVKETSEVVVKKEPTEIPPAKEQKPSTPIPKEKSHPFTKKTSGSERSKTTETGGNTVTDSGKNTTTKTKRFARAKDYKEYKYSPDTTFLDLFKGAEPKRRLSEEKLAERRAKFAAFGDLAQTLGQLAGKGYAPVKQFSPNANIQRNLDRADGLRNMYANEMDAYRKQMTQLSMKDYLGQKAAHAEANKPIEIEETTQNFGKKTTNEIDKTTEKGGTKNTTELDLLGRARLGSGSKEGLYTPAGYARIENGEDTGKDVQFTKSDLSQVAGLLKSRFEKDLFSVDKNSEEGRLLSQISLALQSTDENAVDRAHLAITQRYYEEFRNDLHPFTINDREHKGQQTSKVSIPLIGNNTKDSTATKNNITGF